MGFSSKNWYQSWYHTFLQKYQYRYQYRIFTAVQYQYQYRYQTCDKIQYQYRIGNENLDLRSNSIVSVSEKVVSKVVTLKLIGSKGQLRLQGSRNFVGYAFLVLGIGVQRRVRGSRKRVSIRYDSNYQSCEGIAKCQPPNYYRSC